MEALRVHIRGWTASFRYPMFIAGFQPTLPVPPLSTIYGILSSAKGELVTLEDVCVGYIFKCGSKFKDMEIIYELDEKNKFKTNICNREILYEPDLFLYILDKSFEKYFKKPAHHILLGRSQDIAQVCEIKTIELKDNIEKGLFGGTTVPFPNEEMYGMIQALPSYFTNTVPRYPAKVRPFHVVKDFRVIDFAEILFDEEINIGVYIHGRN